MATDQLDILDAKYSEQTRIRGIQALSRQPFMGSNGDLWAERMIKSGCTIEQARESANKMAQDYGASYQKPIGKALGLSTREASQFSLARALSTPVFEMEKGIELECHRALLERMPAQERQKVKGLLIPVSDLRGWAGPPRNRSVQSVGGNGGSYGGNLVATNLDDSSFIEVLSNTAQVMKMGCTVLPGQIGDLAIPKQMSSLSTTWLDENQPIDFSTLTVGLINMSPKTCGAIAQFTRKMLLQATPAIEQILKADLMRTVALAIDKAAISGIGDLEPVGIMNQEGVADLGSSGADGDELDYDLLVEMETKVKESNVSGESMAYLMTNRLAKTCKTKTENSSNVSQWIWRPHPDGLADMGFVNGMSAAITEQLPKDGTKGAASNLHGIVFGLWSDLIVAQWGALEIQVNPFSTGFRSGSIETRIMTSLDIALRHPSSFCYSREIIPG